MDVLLKEPTFCQKSQLVKLAQKLRKTEVFETNLDLNSWLTVSNQIVKSLSLFYKNSYFFNMVQPTDLLFGKMAEIIK